MLKYRGDLRAVDEGGRSRKPQLLERVRRIIGKLLAERRHRPSGLGRSTEQRQRGHQEELRASVGGVAVQGFPQQGDRLLGAAKQQLGEPAIKQKNALPPIGSIEAHGPLGRRQSLVGATEEGRVVAGESVSQPKPRIQLQRLLDGLLRLFQPPSRRVQQALDTLGEGMPRCEVERQGNYVAAEVG